MSQHEYNPYTPTRYSCPRGDLYVCGQQDITGEFADACSSPLIVTCKNARVPAVDLVAKTHGLRRPLLFNIGYFKGREATFYEVLDDARKHLDHGNDVILHCRAGIHRAALSFCLMLMFFFRIRFQEARRRLETIRRVELDDILEGGQRDDGTWRRGHTEYIGVWEKTALSSMNVYELLPRLHPGRRSE
jgi:hypothetical protein